MCKESCIPAAAISVGQKPPIEENDREKEASVAEAGLSHLTSIGCVKIRAFVQQPIPCIPCFGLVKLD